MRLSLLLGLPLLAACSSPMPLFDPLNSRVNFRAPVTELLMAEMLDGKRVADGRYFEFVPGAHRLRVSYRYEVEAGGSLLAGRVLMLCWMQVDYPDFQPDTQYVIEAQHWQYEPQAWLLGPAGEQLVQAEKLYCQQE